MRRLRSDRGAVLVEAVFVLPVVIFIILAIFEYGLLYAASATTQSSTRDGARYASANFAVAASTQTAADAVADQVANDLGARTAYDTPLVLWVYKAQTNGTPQSGNFSSCGANCFVYTWNGTGFSRDTGHTQAWTTVNDCINTSIDNIGVYVQLRHSYITGAFGSSTLISEHTVTRLEPLPLSDCGG